MFSRLLEQVNRTGGAWSLKQPYLLTPVWLCVLCLVTLLYLTLCEPMDYRLPGSSVDGDSPGKNTGVGATPSLLQGIFPTQEGIFPTQGLNSGLCIAGGFFTIWVTREAQEHWSG